MSEDSPTLRDDEIPPCGWTTSMWAGRRCRFLRHSGAHEAEHAEKCSSGNPHHYGPCPINDGLRDAIERGWRRTDFMAGIEEEVRAWFASRVWSPERIEAAARVINETSSDYRFGVVTPWERLDESVRAHYRKRAEAALRAAVAVSPEPAMPSVAERPDPTRVTRHGGHGG